MNMKSIHNQFSFLTLCIMANYIPMAYAQDFYFDPDLLEGSGVALNLSKLNENVIKAEPGKYRVDLYVNDKLISDNTEIIFGRKSKDEDNDIEPCLNIDDFRRIQLKPDAISLPKIAGKCVWFSDFTQSTSWDFDQPTLKLNLLVPQSLMFHQPRGFIPISEWDGGTLGFFIKHNTNYYETKNAGGYTTRNLWSGINSGTNLGLWQLRNQSNLTYTESHAGKTQKWTNVSNSAQRPLPTIESLLTVGDSYTNSSLFGSLSFNGVKLASDTPRKGSLPIPATLQHLWRH